MRACEAELLGVEDDTFFDIGYAPLHRIIDVGSKFAKMTSMLDKVFAFDLAQYLKVYPKKGEQLTQT